MLWYGQCCILSPSRVQVTTDMTVFTLVLCSRPAVYMCTLCTVSQRGILLLTGRRTLKHSNLDNSPDNWLSVFKSSPFHDSKFNNQILKWHLRGREKLWLWTTLLQCVNSIYSDSQPDKGSCSCHKTQWSKAVTKAWTEPGLLLVTVNILDFLSPALSDWAERSWHATQTHVCYFLQKHDFQLW